MKNYKQIFANLLNDESGQDLVEYALVVAMVAGIALTASGSLSTIITGAITSVGGKITAAIGS
ncbi:Flp family type IVb pilin [Edaphobacter paludis]|uniref:Flp family type IVb pilin n=1 Tax=Edaphobacter paludis TaxID=3035702 RepID=A0AAU7D2H6_9BACT